MIKKTKRKWDELDVELNKVANKQLWDASKTLEKEHIMVEGTLIWMVTDSQKHNKTLKTELDEVKHELETYKNPKRSKKKFKLRIMAYAKNFAHIPQIQLKSTLTITIFRPTSMLNIKDNKKSKSQRNKN